MVSRGRCGCAVLLVIFLVVQVRYIIQQERAGNVGRHFGAWFQYIVFTTGCWLHWKVVGGSFRGYTSAVSGFNNGYVLHTDIEGDSGPPVPLAVSLMAYFRPKVATHGALKVYDLGCGKCNYCYSLNTLGGITCVGIDGSRSIKSMGENYMQRDLSNFIPLTDADYIMSFEVGEHLAPGTEGIFLKTMMQSKHGIVLTWARPGQGGPGHTNELPQYVLRDIIEPTFAYNATAVAGIREFLPIQMGKMFHYANMMVFDRQDPQAPMGGGNVELSVVFITAVVIAVLLAFMWYRLKFLGVAVLRCCLCRHCQNYRRVKP